MSKKVFENFIDQEIRVEQKHIDKGEACNCHRCPVALALLEQVPSCDGVQVQDTISLLVMGDRLKVKTPPDALRIIDDYDRTGVMRPFTFRLTIP